MATKTLLNFMVCSFILSGTLLGTSNIGKAENQSGASAQAKEVVTLGGGCFWCIEAVFEELDGVVLVESGYSGGQVANPTYGQVCTGKTGHAEVVQITFDPKTILLKEILEVFFTVHDPTTLNRQGADAGTQYRSIIFYHNEEQKAVAEGVIREVQEAKLWNAPIVTEIAPFKAFYKAEDYHQGYYKLHTDEPYCRMVIEPKVKKFREYLRKKYGR